MGTTIAGLEGVIAGESEICYIDGYQGILSYRGYNIHTLADNAIFEEVVFLLWNGWLPKQAELDQLKRELIAARGIPQPIADFLATGPKANPMDVLRKKYFVHFKGNRKAMQAQYLEAMRSGRL